MLYGYLIYIYTKIYTKYFFKCDVDKIIHFKDYFTLFIYYIKDLGKFDAYF